MNDLEAIDQVLVWAGPRRVRRALKAFGDLDGNRGRWRSCFVGRLVWSTPKRLWAHVRRPATIPPEDGPVALDEALWRVSGVFEGGSMVRSVTILDRGLLYLADPAGYTDRVRMRNAIEALTAPQAQEVA